MTTAATDPLIGRTLDERYVVRTRIARGGMAVVYVAEDLRLHRQVAVKIMHAHLADDENFTRRFEQEARSAAGLGHPNVVNVFDQGIDQGVPYLVMEYLPGITLRDLLKQQQFLTVDQATEIGEAVLAGLAAAHDAGFMHRDVKPENVLLADDGRIKIGDFGLARAVSANTTTGQALLGTIAYLSPELVTRGVADERTDLYAFGIMLFEMLTGKQPYTGEQPMQIAYQHAHDDVPAPSTLATNIPPELDAFVQWLTSREPAGRPSGAREAHEQLRRVRGGQPLNQTTAFAATAAFTHQITPATTVLSGAEVDALSHDDTHEASVTTSSTSNSESTASPVAKVARVAATRRKRGSITAAVLVVFIALAGGGGWWFGQGPGSQVSVPDVTGLSVEDATAVITSQALIAEIFECSSLTIAAGLAVSTEPKVGARVDRETTVRVCQSTGPEMLAVPTLVDLSLEDAQNAIQQASFTFGEVLSERFDGGTAGTVILAVNTDGEGLSDTYPEQGTINLIVSAGSLPDVAGLDPATAAKAIETAGLGYDAAANTEAHSELIDAGRVITLQHGETVNVGDSVSVRVSLGPELFTVPDVAGKRMREAIQTLRDAGFEPTTEVPELLWNAVRVESTNPASGAQVAKGTRIRLNYEL